MFDGIAGRYDLLNHLLSLNQDRKWRRHTVRQLAQHPPRLVLDLCGGTGDLTLELARGSGAERVVCCDFSHRMLTVARNKFARTELGERCELLEADALRLPVADGTFDAVTIAFGVRNFEEMTRGFEEILRALRPGGRMVVLEFSRPTAPVIASLYRFYLRRILPLVGGKVSGRSGPYSYLAETISAFPDPDSLAGTIRECGFAACAWTTLSGGIVAIHTAHKGS